MGIEPPISVSKKKLLSIAAMVRGMLSKQRSNNRGRAAD